MQSEGTADDSTVACGGDISRKGEVNRHHDSPRNRRGIPKRTDKASSQFSGNVLDSAPAFRRHSGKVRDPTSHSGESGPLRKKPTKLKRAILDARECALKEEKGEDYGRGRENQAKQESIKSRAARQMKLPKKPVDAPQAYCCQLLTPEIDAQTRFIVGELARFQQRQVEKAKGMVKPKLRFVSGLREVERGVTAGTIKLVFLAPDVEDGAAFKVKAIISKASMSNAEIVFALSRKELGNATAIGVYSLDGVYKETKTLLTLTQEARVEWGACHDRGSSGS